MSLINCPECGRKKISDTVVSCPECGFEIKKYFDKERKKEEKKQKETLKQQQQEKRFKELTKNIYEEFKKIDELPYPDKPNYFKTVFFHGGWKLLLTLALLFIIGFFSESMFFIVIFAILLVIGIPVLLFLSYFDYSGDRDTYYAKTENWEAYKENLKKERLDYYREQAKRDKNYIKNEEKKKQIKHTIIISEDSRKSAGSSIARGAVGGALFGVAGAVGGALSGKNVNSTTFSIVYNSGENEIVTVENDSSEYAKLIRYLR